MMTYQLFDTLLEPVFILNSEAKVVYCNETASVVAGISARKMIRSGQKLHEILVFSEPIEQLEKLQDVKDPTPYREINFHNQEGIAGKVQITIQPIANESTEDNSPRWIVFVRDVTLEERLQKKYRAELEQKEEFIKHLEDAQKQLKEYSEKLEVMVAERTAELSKLNQLMSALLDSLNQGFFVFDQNGKVLEIASKACLSVIESMPQGKYIWDVLKLPESKVEGFKKWMTTLFMEMLPFEDLAPLGPPTFNHSQSKNIQLEYFPMRTDGSIQGVVVVASDITSLVEAQHQAEYEKSHAQLIIKLIRSKREISRFIRDADELLKALGLELKKPEGPDKETSFRYLHTLKGGAATFSISDMAERAHQAESVLMEDPRSKILVEKVKEIELAYSDFVEEAKEIIGSQVHSSERWVEIPASEIRNWADYLAQIPGGKSFAAELRNQYLSEPIQNFFSPYIELCQRIAEQEGKTPPAVLIHDNHLRVNPDVYGHLFATFVHAFRNSMDHGIETPEERESLGKPSKGKIQLHFNLELNGLLRIEFSDDGRGIDPSKIRNKLASKGYAHQMETDLQVIQHIFDSQFSTKEVLTETSGRGVGMDAIANAASEIGGKAWVESSLGFGTTLIVEVPYFFEKKSATVKPAAA